MGSAAKIDYRDLQVDNGQMGRADSLRYNVMTHVVQEEYDRAIEELRLFHSQDSEFPMLGGRVLGYTEHAIDLVNGIRTKRNFPGFKNLPVSKQQDLSDKFKEHFNELENVLRQIEIIQLEVRLDDMRSTVWVVRSVVIAVAAIVGVAFSIEVSSGLLATFLGVVDDGFLRTTIWLGSLIGF